MPAKPCPAARSAADFLPRKISLPTLAKAAKKCRGCDLFCHASRVVFGEGPPDARLVLIGEQPGDQEDLAGKPFVGPSGHLLDDTLAAAGIVRNQVYLTNAVKHFKWTPAPRGKRRLHARPNTTEIAACRPWLLEELRLIQPPLIVTLGATAAQCLLGRSFKLTHHRRELVTPVLPPAIPPFAFPTKLLATIHPSALLRMPEKAARDAARADFLKDFQLIARRLEK